METGMNFAGDGGTMKNNTTNSRGSEPPKVEGAVDGCELNVSANGEWLRLIVSGKLVASFHTDYARKVLASAEKSKASARSPKKASPLVLGQDL